MFSFRVMSLDALDCSRRKSSAFIAAARICVAAPTFVSDIGTALALCPPLVNPQVSCLPSELELDISLTHPPQSALHVAQQHWRLRSVPYYEYVGRFPLDERGSVPIRDALELFSAQWIGNLLVGTVEQQESGRTVSGELAISRTRCSAREATSILETWRELSYAYYHHIPRLV